MLLSKITFQFTIILLFLTLVAQAQESSSVKEPEFMPDRSDFSEALKDGSFQFQSTIYYSWVENNNTTSNQLALPVLVLRYGFSNNFTLQLQSEFDLKETLIKEDVVNKNSQIGYILLGLLYQLEQKERIAFFDRLSFLFTNSLPLISSYTFYSEFDLVFVTSLSKRFILEYGAGYRYVKNNDGDFNFLAEITANITQIINSTLSYSSLYIVEGNPLDSQNSVGFEVNIIPTLNYQFDLNYTIGINQNSNVISRTFIYTFN